jgi:hypothetical protein
LTTISPNTTVLALVLLVVVIVAVVVVVAINARFTNTCARNHSE